MCAERGVGIVVGSPYASGILATGTKVQRPFYNYLPATETILEKTKRIEEVCERHNVPLKAAAYQYPLRHPIVASVVSGAGSPKQAGENAGQVNEQIPEEFWQELKASGLLHPLSP